MRLFAIPLPTSFPPETFDRLLALLPEASQDRIKRFRLPEDALRSLVGRLAPIWYLRRSKLISSSEMPVFGREGKGKPKLLEPVLTPPVAFNDSHDGDYVLLGIVRGEDAGIGVDLMQLSDNPLEVQEGISEQLLPSEQQALAVKLTDRDRARRITTLWTLKEGYTKAIGEGIGFGLERIKVDLDEGGQARKVWVDGRDLRDEGWEWLCGPLGDGGYGWAAYWQGDVLEDGPGVELVMNEVEWEEFLKHFDETSSQPVL